MKADIMDISIIIPNYNGQRFLSACLTSLHKAINHHPSIKYEIILVDNGSIDNSHLLFQKFCTDNKLDHQLIKLSSNTGFANAVNIGINAAKYDYVCLTNNDLIIDPNWFKYIARTISESDPRTAAYCGSVLNKDGSQIESQGLKFEIRGKCLQINNLLPINEASLKSNPKYVWGSSAALVIYKKNIIKEIGLFDELLFAYEEDVDLALRLHNLNYKTLLIPNAICYHLGGGTSKSMGNFRNIHDAKNWFYIIIKNYSMTEISQNLIPITIERLRNLSGLIKETVNIYKLRSIYVFPISIVRAYLPILINLPLIFKKRHQYQSLLKLNQT